MIVRLFQRFLFGRKTDRKKRNRRPAALANASYQLSPAQISRIVGACTCERDRALITTFVFAGLRRAEAAALQVDDIVWDRSLLFIRHGKGDKERLVPIPRSLLNDLRALIGTRTQGPIFVSRTGGQLSLRQINRIVSKAGVAAGVSHPNPRYRTITCHLFRHTLARLWKDRRGSMETLSSILGHQSVKTTWDVYGKESMEDIRANYNKTITQMFRRD